MDYSGLPFPKPTKRKKYVNGVKTLDDGREVCSRSPAGRAEWKRRRQLVWERDHKICQICHDPRPMTLEEATADHIIPRGMGGATRDDRIENLQLAHHKCNTMKGSQRDYVHPRAYNVAQQEPTK